VVPGQSLGQVLIGDALSGVKLIRHATF